MRTLDLPRRLADIESCEKPCVRPAEPSARMKPSIAVVVSSPLAEEPGAQAKRAR